MLAKVVLHAMRQDREETVRSFGARLLGQAAVCKLIMKCSSCETDVNFTDAILRGVLFKGMADSKIQFDLIGD